MSIFGFKRKNILNEETNKKVTKQINEEIPKQINKELTRQINEELTRQINEELTGQINSLISRQLTLVKHEQSTLYSAISTLVGNLNTKINKLEKKKIISIFAESKGILRKNEMFSFGNGGKETDVGYLMCYPGKIISIGLYSKRTKGDVGIIIYVNGDDQDGYELNLGDLKGTHVNFDTPLEVEAGDTIGFVCKTRNTTTENTVASMIIEITI